MVERRGAMVEHMVVVDLKGRLEGQREWLMWLEERVAVLEQAIARKVDKVELVEGGQQGHEEVAIDVRKLLEKLRAGGE